MQWAVVAKCSYACVYSIDWTFEAITSVNEPWLLLPMQWIMDNKCINGMWLLSLNFHFPLFRLSAKARKHLGWQSNVTSPVKNNLRKFIIILEISKWLLHIWRHAIGGMTLWQQYILPISLLRKCKMRDVVYGWPLNGEFSSCLLWLKMYRPCQVKANWIPMWRKRVLKKIIILPELVLKLYVIDMACCLSNNNNNINTTTLIILHS